MSTLKRWFAGYLGRAETATVIDKNVRIELVREDGRLVGRTASDRWNLMTLGLDLTDSRNQTDIKRARRMWGCEFDFSVMYGAKREDATDAEFDAFGGYINLALVG
jgi:hypothetical protein